MAYAADDEPSAPTRRSARRATAVVAAAGLSSGAWIPPGVEARLTPETGGRKANAALARVAEGRDPAEGPITRAASNVMPLAAQVTPVGVAARVTPLGAGEASGADLAPTSDATTTVRVSSRRGAKPLVLAGRDGVDAAALMRWRRELLSRGASGGSSGSSGGAIDVDIEGYGDRAASVVAAAAAVLRGVGGPATAAAAPGGGAGARRERSRRGGVGAAANRDPSARGTSSTSLVSAAMGDPALVASSGALRARSVGGRRPALGAALRGDVSPTATIGATLLASAPMWSDGRGPASAWSAERREAGQPAGYAGRWFVARDADGEPVPVPRGPSDVVRPELAYLADGSVAELRASPEVARATGGGRRATDRRSQGGEAPAAPVGTTRPTASVEPGWGGVFLRDGGASRDDAAAADRMDALGAFGGPPAPGIPRLAGGERAQGLLAALARTRRADEVMQVVLEHAGSGAELRELEQVLPEPAARALHEIREMRSSAPTAELLSPGVMGGAEPAAVTPEGARRAARRSNGHGGVRRVRGFGGSRASTASTTQGAGDSRLMKLSQKLMDLIHLAEVERREGDAQRQVRRSDEKVEAPTHGRGGQVDVSDGVSLASLQREVLEHVQRELDSVRERGEGGRHGDFWW
jgi:hypothetical protein